MTEPCDHTSVGIITFRDGKLLLIDRKRPPFGLAAPAGHVDKHGDPVKDEIIRYEKAAVEELEEETGLRAISLDLIAEGRKENACRRPGGSWHYWRIYRSATLGELNPSPDETRSTLWCDKTALKELLGGHTILLATGRQIGLEPVWREWFTEIDVLKMF